MKHTLKQLFNVRKLIDRTNYYTRGRISRMSKIYLQNIDKKYKKIENNGGSNINNPNRSSLNHR